jgi:hypothetical protein
VILLVIPVVADKDKVKFVPGFNQTPPRHEEDPG